MHMMERKTAKELRQEGCKPWKELTDDEKRAKVIGFSIPLDEQQLYWKATQQEDNDAAQEKVKGSAPDEATEQEAESASG